MLRLRPNLPLLIGGALTLLLLVVALVSLVWTPENPARVRESGAAAAQWARNAVASAGSGASRLSSRPSRRASRRESITA